MLWNVRSLVNNLKFHFITQTLADNDIHIACITESWLSPDQGHSHTISEIKKNLAGISVLQLGNLKQVVV